MQNKNHAYVPHTDENLKVPECKPAGSCPQMRTLNPRTLGPNDLGPEGPET